MYDDTTTVTNSRVFLHSVHNSERNRGIVVDSMDRSRPLPGGRENSNVRKSLGHGIEDFQEIARRSVNRDIGMVFTVKARLRRGQNRETEFFRDENSITGGGDRVSFV